MDDSSDDSEMDSSELDGSSVDEESGDSEGSHEESKHALGQAFLDKESDSEEESAEVFFPQIRELTRLGRE